MTIKLPLRAIERSSYIIPLTFLLVSSEDESGVVTEVTEPIYWSLYDSNGMVINSRKDVELVPTENLAIVLSGNDLLLLGDYPAKRKLEISFTYLVESGDEKTFNEELIFQIENTKS